MIKHIHIYKIIFSVEQLIWWNIPQPKNTTSSLEILNPQKHPNFGGWNSAFAVQLKDGSQGWIWMVFCLWFRPFFGKKRGHSPTQMKVSKMFFQSGFSMCQYERPGMKQSVPVDFYQRTSEWPHSLSIRLKSPMTGCVQPPALVDLQSFIFKSIWGTYIPAFSLWTIYFSMFFQIRIYRSSAAFPCISPERCGVFFHENVEDPQLAKLEKLKAFSSTSDREFSAGDLFWGG